jgi:iron complex outermembrane recepter protein
VPLEETGTSVSFRDVSKKLLPGIYKWVGSLGGEIVSDSKKFL